MTKLESVSRQKMMEIEYKIDRGSGGKLIQISTFKIYFPGTFRKHNDKSMFLWTCNKTDTSMLGMLDMKLLDILSMKCRHNKPADTRQRHKCAKNKTLIQWLLTKISTKQDTLLQFQKMKLIKK